MFTFPVQTSVVQVNFFMQIGFPPFMNLPGVVYSFIVTPEWLVQKVLECGKVFSEVAKGIPKLR